MKGEMTARYDGEHWTVRICDEKTVTIAREVSVREKNKVLGKYTAKEFCDAINDKKYLVPGPETSSEWHKAREVFK